MPQPTPEIALPIFTVAGVDEVGRGPLAGPVVAAAVILDPQRPISGLLDSKLLDQATRETLDVQIRKHALAFCIAEASVAEIDTINILHASMLAMKRAVEGLCIAPELALIDGNRCPDLNVPVAAVVKGDQKVQAISAASIIAKVARDRLMVEMDQRYPQFGFAQHKGYPTPVHKLAILEHGVADIHRRSFKPVREALKIRGELRLQPITHPLEQPGVAYVDNTPLSDMGVKVAEPSAIDAKQGISSASTIDSPEQPIL